MSFYNPDLRQPVIEWFRELLRYYADYSQSHDVDCEQMGLRNIAQLYLQLQR